MCSTLKGKATLYSWPISSEFNLKGNECLTLFNSFFLMLIPVKTKAVEVVVAG